MLNIFILFQKPVYDLRNLTFINGRVVTDGFLLGLSSCPLIENLVIRFTDLKHDLLYHVMELRNLKQLHLGNSSYTEVPVALALEITFLNHLLVSIP